MPEMDGFEVLRRIKEQPSSADIPVIVVTAKDLHPTEIEELRRQARAIIRKEGIWKDGLLASVQRITESMQNISSSGEAS